jgi:hypothetical protein
MIEKGIEIRDAFKNGVKDTKVELEYYLSEKEMQSVGDYRFVYGEVSLEFLVEEPKMNY